MPQSSSHFHTPSATLGPPHPDPAASSALESPSTTTLVDDSSPRPSRQTSVSPTPLSQRRNPPAPLPVDADRPVAVKFAAGTKTKPATAKLISSAVGVDVPARAHRDTFSDLDADEAGPGPTALHHKAGEDDEDEDDELLDDDDLHDPATMPSDLRPPYHRPTDGKSGQPLLGAGSNHKPANGYDGDASRPSLSSHNRRASSRRSTFKERDPDTEAKDAIRKRYLYAAFFLLVSLVSFAVQTETAVYIKKYLGWQKSYAMLYFTHGSWSILWFLQMFAQRIQKWSTPNSTFFRRQIQILRETALMVKYNDLNAPQRYPHDNPWPHMLRMTAFVTCALTVAGGSWYVAVSWTTASDLTAIYNCSAFFAYAFSVPILKERLRWSKVIAVGVAIVGVLVVAYGDSDPAKHGSKSGGGTGGPDPSEDSDSDSSEGASRLMGNLVIGIGSVLYGLYEVLYKKFACPPDATSPGRGMIFANFFGTCIGLFTLSVLWIPLPILHWTGLETWEWPSGEASWMLAISTVSNAVFSGSFLVLISLTSPVLSSVAALLTIFLVALVDQLLPPPLHNALSTAALFGGLLIIIAFLVLAWATYREMDEDMHKKAEYGEAIESDDEADALADDEEEGERDALRGRDRVSSM